MALGGNCSSIGHAPCLHTIPPMLPVPLFASYLPRRVFSALRDASPLHVHTHHRYDYYVLCLYERFKKRRGEAKESTPAHSWFCSPFLSVPRGLRSGLCTILMHTSDSDHKRRYHLHALENKADVEASGVVVVAAERQDIPLESRGRLSALYVIATIRSRFTGARATEVFSLF